MVSFPPAICMSQAASCHGPQGPAPDGLCREVSSSVSGIRSLLSPCLGFFSWPYPLPFQYQLRPFVSPSSSAMTLVASCPPLSRPLISRFPADTSSTCHGPMQCSPQSQHHSQPLNRGFRQPEDEKQAGFWDSTADGRFSPSSASLSNFINILRSQSGDLP